MSRVPNFADMAFEPVAVAAPTSTAKSWLTPEGIAVKHLYGQADLKGLADLDT